MVVNVIIIRHAHSTANEHYDIHRQVATDHKYKNAGLSNKGILSIEKISELLNKKINQEFKNIHFIIASPLKRALQTGSMLFKNSKIHVSPVISEVRNDIENRGVALQDLSHEVVNAHNLDYTFYDDEEWHDNDDHYTNIDERILKFKQFLSNKIFDDKNVILVSHSQFIFKLLKEYIRNLGVIVFSFDQENHEIKIKNIVVDLIED
jgi:broad specificity phosphatase PhoE